MNRLPYYLSIAEGITDEFMPFSGELALNEAQIASSRIWIHVHDFISYDVNNYTTHTRMSVRAYVFVDVMCMCL